MDRSGPRGDHPDIRAAGSAGPTGPPAGDREAAAYAGRQAIFFLSRAAPVHTRAALDDPSVATAGPGVMSGLMTGLRAATDGTPTVDHVPFLGWTVARHGFLDPLGQRTER